MPRMTGNAFLVEALKAYEVDHLFFVPSILGGAMSLMDGAGIKRVITHGEKAAAYMADGYARASHKPGIACARTSARRTSLPACATRSWPARR